MHAVPEKRIMIKKIVISAIDECKIEIPSSAIFLLPSENVQLSTVLHPHMGHLNKLLTSIV